MVFKSYFLLGYKDTFIKEIGKLSLKNAIHDSNIDVKADTQKILTFDHLSN